MAAGGGDMLLTLAPLFIVSVAIAVLVGLLISTRKKSYDAERSAEIQRMIDEGEGASSETGREAGGGVAGQSRGFQARRRRGARTARNRGWADDEGVEEQMVVQRAVGGDTGDQAPGEGEDGEAEEGTETLTPQKGRRKKDANRAAKEEQKLAQQAYLQQQREKEERRAEKQREKDEEREQREREEEEERRRQEEEEERKKQEEFDKWKDLFTVDSSGSGLAEIEAESQGLLSEFKEYVRGHKVIVLEELAAHFKLRTEDAINRVSTLEREGAITGVFDDRGKFIFIETEEMEAVAKFINDRGRVSIVDLSREAGKLVNLTAG